MTDAKTCPTCGAPLPADATGGACPKCLLQAGFATGGGVPADRTPTPEELAPKFPGLVIASVLGRGGMGVVYKARHRALDRDVALKVLPASLAGDAAFADRFQREARALAKLQHPNIVAVHDFGTTDGLFWLVMEYVDGANIRQAMKAGTIGPKEALAIVPQICDALQFAHEHGVVHRDIKPENVLLDRTGRVKVADFGLAKLMEHGESDRTLTGAGQVMGTPHYMAPEQWEHPKDVDHRADIYSLGVVFYEMLTGELPIGRFAAPSKKSDIDARIDEIVMRTLEKEREARYQHADDVKTDVGRVTAAAAGVVAAAGAAAGAGGADPGPRIEAAVNDLLGSVAQVVEGASKRVADRGAAREERHRRTWKFDSAEERARGGRLSKLAVAGALSVPAAIVLGVVLAAVSELAGVSPPTWLVVTVLFGLLLFGWIASLVAWVRISHSGDALRGRGWAAAGTILPLVATCGGLPLLFALSSVPKPASGPGDVDPPSRLVVTRAQDDDVRALLSTLQQHPGPIGKSYWEFYDGESSRRLKALSDEDRERLGAGGSYGFPLMSEATRGGKLDEFELESVGIVDGGPVLQVRVRHKSKGFRVQFRVTYQDGSLKFTSDPAWLL